MSAEESAVAERVKALLAPDKIILVRNYIRELFMNIHKGLGHPGIAATMDIVWEQMHNGTSPEAEAFRKSLQGSSVTFNFVKNEVIMLTRLCGVCQKTRSHQRSTKSKLAYHTTSTFRPF